MADLMDIKVPEDDSIGSESVVATWFKAVGDLVALNEPLLELNTDKVTVEIASPGSGILQEIIKPEGAKVAAGQILGRLQTDSAIATPPKEAPVDLSQEASPARFSRETSNSSISGRQLLSPAVKKLLTLHQINPADITGTGKDGRITAADVENAVRLRSQAPAALERESASSRDDRPSRLIPHSTMRRSIAAHMIQSMLAAPHVTTVFDADLTRILHSRKRLQTAAESRGARLTLTAYFVKAAVEALRAVPEVNSRWHDDGLEVFEDCNIGVGTALDDGGLIVPVIHRAQNLTLLETAKSLTDLTAKARSHKLTPPEVQNGTFTISNHGVSGSIFATPIIINQPQSAILGIGRMERRVVVRSSYGFEVTEVRPMIYVTLTIDHRVLDGFQANRFLSHWVKVIEEWTDEAESTAI